MEKHEIWQLRLKKLKKAWNFRNKKKTWNFEQKLLKDLEKHKTFNNFYMLNSKI